MKRFIALLLCLVMVLSLAACGGGDDAKEPETSKELGQETGFEEMNWKFGISAGETSTWAEAGRYFGELMGEATGGAVTVDVYATDQLFGGSQTDGIQGVIDNTTQIDMHSNLIYASFDDRFSVVSLPFLFANTDEVDAVLDGEGGDALKAILEEMGLHVLGIAENGFRHVTNSKHEIITPADMTGLKIRVAGSSVLMDAYKAWGSDYTTANWNEVYTGLQTGTYDGQENPVPTMDASQIQEVQKYITYWTGSYDCLFFTMNKGLYDSLSPELQAIVDENGQKTAEYQREINRAADEETLARWETDNGVTVHYLTEDEMAAFKELSDPVYDNYAKLLMEEKGMSAEDVTAFLGAFGVEVNV